MMIEMGKKYQTRDGRAVRILCVDRAKDATGWPVVCLIRDSDRSEQVGLRKADGTFQSYSPCGDLVPAPTKHEGWIVVITNYGVSFLYDYIFVTKEGAEHWLRNDTRKGAVIPITFED